MTANSEITLLTSIPPRMSRVIQGREMGPAWQSACIQSWKSCGFKVKTLNTPDEIDVLRSLNMDVEFTPIPPDHKRPHIIDFIAAAGMSKSDVVGIINADCLLIPQVKLIGHLLGLNGLVIAERINLDKISLRPTGRPCMGFDAFFFTTRSLFSIKKEDNWRIGDTWWDYWFPLAFQVAGFEPKTFPAPMLIHLDHDQAWDWAIWERNFSRLNEFLRNSELRDPILTRATKALPELAQAADIHPYGSTVYHWLHAREPLWRPEFGSVDDFTTQFLNAIAAWPIPPPVGRGRALVRRAISSLRLQRVVSLLGLR
jgi:hypothetical protein